jgi:hypothetical protein
VVDHLVEPGHAGFQRLLAVLVEEELGVGQARPHHALVAFDDAAGIGRRDVADDQELVRQPAPAGTDGPRRHVEQREVLLVGLHRQDQAFLGHRQEFGLETAGEHVRPFDQRGHFIEQRGVVDRLQALPRRRRRELALDLGAAHGEAGDHGALRQQLLRVAIGGLDHHRVERRLEAVAVGLAAGVQAQQAHRHDVGAVQRHQAMGRAHEVDAGPAVGKLVLHELGDRQLGEHVVQGLLQAFGQGRALGDAVEEQRVGLAVGLAPELRHDGGIEAERGELLQQHRRGLALGVQADADGHQLLRLRPVVGLGTHRTQVQRQPPRRGKRRRHRCFAGQALRLQAVGQQLCESIAEFLQRLRRQLLDEQLDQQVLRAHGLRPPSCRAAP